MSDCVMPVKKVEDEFHFMMECKSNSDHRQTFINKLTTRCPNFADLSQREQFVYMFTNEDNMSLTWLGKFIYKSFQRRNSVGSNLWNIYWYDYSLCIYIYIYLKTLYIDIKSISYIHEFHASKCIHILLTMIYFRLPGPVYVFLVILKCLWWLCVPYLWYGFHMEVCGFIQIILYQRYAYYACICMYCPIWFYMDFILHGFYMDFIYHGQ